MEDRMTFTQFPPVADGSITTAKLGGDVSDVAKELLQAETKSQQRATIELPNLMAQERF
jgi:hypothetical protein